MTGPRILPGTSRDVLLLCDHASNAVPADIDLGIEARLLDTHIAVDIGAGAVTEALAAALDAPAILATASRLIIDLNRSLDHVGLIPLESDGHAIPGNRLADRGARIAAIYVPHHAAVEAQIADRRPFVIAAIHSFTPRLESVATSPRPWQIGILSNTDRRAAELALAWLRANGFDPGDNQPYSGRELNATLDRHGDARGIASLSIEIRNDLIADPTGVMEWAKILAKMLIAVRNGLAPDDLPAT